MDDAKPAKRGRPPSSPARVALDATIGRTVQRLMLWGVPTEGSGGAHEVASRSKVLADILKKLGQGSISADRVEQIHKRWRAAQRAAYERGELAAGSGHLWAWSVANLTRESRSTGRPSGPLGAKLTNQELADILLSNDGNWPKKARLAGMDDDWYPFDGTEVGIGPDELKLTEKAQAYWDSAPKFRKRGN